MSAAIDAATGAAMNAATLVATTATTGTALRAALLGLAVSLLLSALLVATRRWHLPLTADSQLHLPQKIHRGAVPRIGGAAIVAGFVVGVLHAAGVGGAVASVSPHTAIVLLCALAPIALAGFAEDLTQRVGPRQRLAWMAAGASVLVIASPMWLERIGVPGLDLLFASWPVAIPFTVFACVGAANAYNIVDGLDGLMAGVALITLGAIARVAADVGDAEVFALALLLGAAVLGWLPFNWPRARLFAGDGGAYAIGFTTAAMLLLLVHRNPSVSPWFALTAAALPVWETVYSIWRRSRTGLDAMQPDRAHLHQLLRARLHGLRLSKAVRRGASGASGARPPSAPAAEVRPPNGGCSPLLWALQAVVAGLGASAWSSSAAQALVFGGFALGYVLLHRRLERRVRPPDLAVAG